ncbi:hypothetical protein [Burkholderia cenocepacia]|uniref:hypothetical protein n=1 Tax=Burkholderia cenocepacia TaxID=95486 RepID=UPI0007613AD8|nr:hypothetical protein [Burkholderia cenocepacia]KWU24744.1 hypothetical protein AS149_31870 [Burkholderia cenocepacia]
MAKVITYIAALASLLSLGACSTQPRLSPAEQQAQSALTLNVYPDNSVAIKTTTRSQRTVWHWTSDKDRILTLKVNGKLFNAKDIASATAVETERNSNVYALDFTFKDGHKELAKAGFQFGPTWLVCTRAKNCESETYLTGSDYRKRLGDIVTAVRDTDLQRTQMTQSLDISLMTGGGAAPQVGATVDDFSRFTVLSDSERDALVERVHGVERARSAYASNRTETYNRQKQEKEQLIQDEAARMRKTARIGTQTNCGPVFELRLPMVGVQTMYGMQYLKLSDLFGPSADCRFVNHQYVGR